jgi:hypothetical protein
MVAFIECPFALIATVIWVVPVLCSLSAIVNWTWPDVVPCVVVQLMSNDTALAVTC